MKIYRFETDFNNKKIFAKFNIDFANFSNASNSIKINPDIKYQTFLGFGGAITDSAGFCFNKLPIEKQEDFLKDYFSETGLNYSFARLPIGSSDFSTGSYSYSYKKDLSDFSIKRDFDTIINLGKKALKTNPNIKFLSSPWSPPKFMKNTKMLVLGGKLKKKYRQTYTDYLSKYILEYKKEGINIDFITVQNEPNAVQIWESCIYSPEDEADFAINFLYPTFKKNNINTKILIWDHNKESLFARAKTEMSFPGSNEAISGFAFHWYTGDYFENVNSTSEMFKDKLLIHSEGCTGYSNFRQEDEIKNAEIYAHDIIGDLNNGTNAYIDWNILLDNNGGPNHKKNYCNSPIMLNENNSDYIKNLTYTYIKHFSHLIKPNAKRIDILNPNKDIEITAFKNIDNSIAIIILNRTNNNINFNISIKDTCFSDNINSKSIISYTLGDTFQK